MPIHNLDEFAREAKRLCENQTINNLCLSAEIPVREFEHPFGDAYNAEALLWQAREQPDELHINHGSFIYRNGDAYNFLVSELRRKPDSNRALFSLVDMEDIIGSGDKPIPSFLILQFSRVGTKLFSTAYFRALEVSKFLPVNLAEIAIIVRYLHEKFQDIEVVVLCVHAFRAYSREEFDLLHRAEIDQLRGADIAMAVVDGNLDFIRRLLENKRAESTVAETRGLEELHAALEARKTDASPAFSPAFIREIALAVQALLRLRSAREAASHSNRVEQISVEVKTHLRNALREL